MIDDEFAKKLRARIEDCIVQGRSFTIDLEPAAFRQVRAISRFRGKAFSWWREACELLEEQGNFIIIKMKKD